MGIIYQGIKDGKKKWNTFEDKEADSKKSNVLLYFESASLLYFNP